METKLIAIALGKFSLGLLLTLCSLTPIEQQHPDAAYYSAWSNEVVPPVSAKVPWWPVPCLVGGSLMVWGIVDVMLMQDEPSKQSNPPLKIPKSPVNLPVISQPNLQSNSPSNLPTPLTPPVRGKQTQEVVHQPLNPGNLPNPLPEFIRKLISFPSIIIFGEMGGGKTSKAGYLAALHCQQGHEVEIIDPFLKAGRWRGLKVHGRGENYAQVTSCLANFVKEASRRLRERGEDEKYDPHNEVFKCLICDEIDDWESEIDSKVMKQFILCCTSKLRQANMGVILIAHGDTLTFFGGNSAAGGKKAALERQFLKLETIAMTDASVPGGFRCAGYGYLHQARRGAERVEIPQWMREPPNFDYTDWVGTIQNSQPNPQNLEPQNDIDPLWQEFEQYRQQFED